MGAEWLDEMERVGLWQNEAMSAVVFPSADTLPELRKLDNAQQRLLLTFNPQWQRGQLISDFGWAFPSAYSAIRHSHARMRNGSHMSSILP